MLLMTGSSCCLGVEFPWAPLALSMAGRGGGGGGGGGV